MSTETISREAVRQLHLKKLEKIRDILMRFGPDTDVAHHEVLWRLTEVVAYVMSELERIEEVGR
jgi:hypothetical protein